MTKSSHWPDVPYTGLSHFAQPDAPLFAGRDDDIEACSAILAAATTRLLVLHGRTGSGKSSFLRAGLIPYIEGGVSFFRFLRESDANSPALLIRSTASPMEQLASAIYKVASTKGAIRMRGSNAAIDLAPALLGTETQAEFLLAATQPERLFESIVELARKIPEKLVIVIDQAEEVLTLNGVDRTSPARYKFFRLLQQFIVRHVDVKIVISIRTEYFGWLAAELGAIPPGDPAVAHHYLREFGSTRVKEAIERPTLREPVGDHGIPFEKYRFEYQPGLTSKIAEDLVKADTNGGVLLVMQMVCKGLYESTKRDGTWVITPDDYDRLGAVTGRIEAHVKLAIAEGARAKLLSESDLELEIDQWRVVLARLAQRQDDGTVTTLLKSERDVLRWAAEAGIRGNARGSLSLFVSKEWRILREVDLIDRATGSTTRYYSLGHDAIGLVLSAWNSNREKWIAQRKAMRTLRKRAYALTAISMIVAGAVLSKTFIERRSVLQSTVDRIDTYLSSESAIDGQMSILLGAEAIRNAEALDRGSFFNNRTHVERARETLARLLSYLPARTLNEDLEGQIVNGSSLIVWNRVLAREIDLRSGDEKTIDLPPFDGDRRPILVDIGALKGLEGGKAWIERPPFFGAQHNRLHFKVAEEWKQLEIDSSPTSSAHQTCRSQNIEGMPGLARAYIRNQYVLLRSLSPAAVAGERQIGLKWQVGKYELSLDGNQPKLKCVAFSKQDAPMYDRALGPFYSEDLEHYAQVLEKTDANLATVEPSLRIAWEESGGLLLRVSSTFAEEPHRDIIIVTDHTPLDSLNASDQVKSMLRASEYTAIWSKGSRYIGVVGIHGYAIVDLEDSRVIARNTRLAFRPAAPRGILSDLFEDRRVAVSNTGAIARPLERVSSIAYSSQLQRRAHALFDESANEPVKLEFDATGRFLIGTKEQGVSVWDLEGTNSSDWLSQRELLKTACEAIDRFAVKSPSNFFNEETSILFGAEGGAPVCEHVR